MGIFLLRPLGQAGEGYNDVAGVFKQKQCVSLRLQWEESREEPFSRGDEPFPMDSCRLLPVDGSAVAALLKGSIRTCETLRTGWVFWGEVIS